MYYTNLFFIFHLLISGFSIYSIMAGSRNFAISLGMSFGFGAIYVFTISLLTFIFGLSISFTIFISICITTFLIYKCKNISYKISFGKAKSVEILLILLVLSIFLFVCLQALSHPLIAWDGYASWFLGAKSIYLTEKITVDFYNFANYDFPFLFQSLIAMQSFFNGAFIEENSLILFPVIFASILLLFFGVVSTYYRKSISLISLLLLAGTQELIRHGGYLDIGHIDILIAYFVLMIVSLYLMIKKNLSIRMLLLFQALLTSLVFTKNEGLPYFLLFQTLLLLHIIKNLRQYLKKIVLLVVLITIPVLLWFLFKSHYLPANYRFLEPHFTHIRLLGEGMTLILLEFFNLQRWNFMWVFILACLPFIFKRSLYRDILVLFILQFLIYIIIYFVSSVNPITEINGSFDRLLLQAYPSLFLISVMAISDIKIFK